LEFLLIGSAVFSIGLVELVTLSTHTLTQNNSEPRYRRSPAWARVDFAVATAAILCIAGAADGIFIGVSEPDISGDVSSYNSVYVALRRGIPVIAAIVLSRDMRATFSLILQAWPLAISLAWIVASSLWSLDPRITLIHATSLISVVVIAAALTSRYGVAGAIQPVQYAGILLLMLNLVLLIISPSFAFDHLYYGTVFQGTFVHKNELALFFTCFIICILSGLGNAKSASSLTWSIGLLAGATFLVIRSYSATGIVITAGALLIAAFLWSHRRLSPTVKLVSAIFLILLTVVIGVGIWDDLLHFLGRDQTFTGRTILWEHLLASVSERPVLGFGFGSYWRSQAGAEYYLANWWIAGHAHNGFFDALISGGLILLALLVAQTCMLIAQAGRFVRVSDSATSWLVVLVAGLLPLYNLVEPAYLKQSVTTVLFVVSLFAVPTRSIGDQTNRRILPRVGSGYYNKHTLRPPLIAKRARVEDPHLSKPTGCPY
jgi:O-antigen ligase